MASALGKLIDTLKTVEETSKLAAANSTQETSAVAGTSATATATAPLVLSQSSNIDTQLKTDNKQATEDSWLFKVSKDDREFYLLGTKHDEPLSKFPPCVKDLVSKVYTLITESNDLRNASQILTEIIMKLDGFEKSNINTYQNFDPSIRNNLETALKNVGQEKLISLLPKLKPWVIYIIFLYLEGIQIQTSGIDHELIDSFLKKEKQNVGKICGLETRLDLIKAYKNNTLEFEECKQKMMAVNFDNQKINIKQDSELYFSGNMLKNIQADRTYSKDDPVNVRNANWIKKLEEELLQKSKGPILVAVGVTHLYSGDSGLLSSFTKKGYTIQRYDTQGQLKAFNWQAEFAKVEQAITATATATAATNTAANKLKSG